MRHHEIWQAIERLAATRGLSPSALARAAGLDPTTFNQSKRTGANGKERWPSTESLAKILAATGVSMGQFAALAEGSDDISFDHEVAIPVIGHAKAGRSGYFDDAGFPAGSGWEMIAWPGLDDPHAYAVEISGDSMEPVYRDGDRIIVSPAARIRRGDRVVVRTVDGEVMVKELAKRSARQVVLRSVNPTHEDRVLAAAEIEWIARVIWASQ